jgi:hypothetical protein
LGFCLLTKIFVFFSLLLFLGLSLSIRSIFFSLFFLFMVLTYFFSKHYTSKNPSL